MKKYILLLFIRNTREAFKALESLLSNKEEDYRTSNVKIEGNHNIITFKSNHNISEIKEAIKNAYEKPPLFFLIDADKPGETFDMYFAQLEPIMLLENGIESLRPEIKDEDMTLNDLLDLMSKNGYSSLTDGQKAKLRKYSEE